jgi:orotate phosphoribosyltransferase
VRLTSGYLSDGYVNFGATERDYRVVDRACHEIALQLREQQINADIVSGAQMGSVRLSLPLAHSLGIATSIYTEKDGDAMRLKRHDL